METNATDKPVPREIKALLSDERLILRETPRAVTQFGGTEQVVRLWHHPTLIEENDSRFSLYLRSEF
jgi:hypothetical protein